jgi:hypothetical protein
MPAGDEIFLFHQGYEAPGPYELFIASAPQTSDREQQERILGLAAAQQQQQQQQQEEGAWQGGRAGPQLAVCCVLLLQPLCNCSYALHASWLRLAIHGEGVF